MVDSLGIIIGLFCFGTFSLSNILQHLKETYKINLSDIKHISLSKDFVVQTENETVYIPMNEITEHILPSCRTCVDFTAELADISVGSAYPLQDWSVVILRTTKGEEFFYKAVKDGVLNTSVIEHEPRVYERVIIAALNKRFNAFKESEKIEKAYGYVPVQMLRETDELAVIKVEEIMTKNVKSVSAKTSVKHLLNLMANERHIAYPVIDENSKLMGIVTIEEAFTVPKEKRDITLVGAITRKRIATVKVGKNALDAFRKMRREEVGRVIVVDSAEPNKILGIVTKTDLMHALIMRARSKSEMK